MTFIKNLNPNNQIYCKNTVIIGHPDITDNSPIDIVGRNKRPITIEGKTHGMLGNELIRTNYRTNYDLSEWIQISTIEGVVLFPTVTWPANQIPYLRQLTYPNGLKQIFLKGFIFTSGANFPANTPLFNLPDIYTPPKLLHVMNYGEYQVGLPQPTGGMNIFGMDSAAENRGKFTKQISGAQSGLDGISYFL